MIYTVIADIKNFNADKFLEKCVSGEDFFKIEKCRINPLPSSVYALPSISVELLDHIRSVSNERLRKERAKIKEIVFFIIVSPPKIRREKMRYVLPQV